MQSTATFKTESTTTQQYNAQNTRKQECIFAVLLYDGRIIIGKDSDAPRRIANLNGGMLSICPKALQVRRIIGIKEVNETRTLPSVVAQFCRDFGEERVVCL